MKQEIRIFGIFSDLSYFEYTTAQKAYENNPLIVIKEIAEINNKTKYYYSGININNEDIPIELNGWKAELKMYGYQGYFDTPVAVIIAPDGSIYREDSRLKNCCIYGIVQTIDYMIKISEFRGLREFKFAKELELLHERIKSLESELKEIKEKLE